MNSECQRDVALCALTRVSKAGTRSVADITCYVGFLPHPTDILQVNISVALSGVWRWKLPQRRTPEGRGQACSA